MSFLHKNDVLKEYRRQHREEVAARQAADNAAAVGTHHSSNDINDDEFPDVDAFQVVGGSSSASPTYVRPSPQASVMSVMGEGSSGGTSTTNPDLHFRAREERGKAGDANGKQRPSPLAVRASPHDDDGADAAAGDTSTDVDGHGRQRGTGSSKAASSVKSIKTGHDGAGLDSNITDNGADEFVSMDHYSPPLAPPSRTVRPNANAAGLAAVPQGVPVPRSRSDLTGEEDRATKDIHLHSSGTDPAVSPTTLTTGVETFLSATDVADGANATGGPSFRVTGGTAVQGTQKSNAKSNNSSAARVLNSPGGLPLSPASSKPHSPTSFMALPLSLPMDQLNAAHAAQGMLRVDANHGPTNVDVSSSSSSEAPSESNGRSHQIKKHLSLLSEEAVGKLSVNMTNNSIEGDTLLTGESPGIGRLDVSDTLLQPPTSILSEPSTLDTSTANLASLRNRSHARKAAERQSSAGRLPPQGRGGLAVQMPPPPRDASTVAGADSAKDAEDDVFSRASAAEYVDGAGSADHFGPVSANSRAAVGPSHLLSFSGIAGTFPRIGDDEDVDVDPSSTVTDPTGRVPLTMQPITFYEAYAELTREMKRGVAAAKDRAHGGKPSAPTPFVAHPAPQNASVKRRSKTGLLASLMRCCSPQESDVRTRQPPAYARAGADLDRVGADSAQAGENAASSAVAAAAVTSDAGAAESALQVVHFLKSLPLSLQNSVHRRVLSTVFNILTDQVPWPHLRQKAADPARLTPPSSMRSVRWELIGFQGSNPATDVRATGVLGVLQLLYLVDYYPVFAKRLWDLCQNPSGVKPPAGGEAAFTPPRAPAKVSNELPFVLVCFNFTALVLDAADQHLLDAEIAKAEGALLAPVVPVVAMAGCNKPEAHLAASPGMFVCCEAFVGALALFGEAWCDRRRVERRALSSLPPLSRPSIAAFGEVKAKLCAQVLKKNGATLLRDAVERVRGEALLGFE
ncbi:hypothetical protein ABB37_05080 [Leptomonas pyrrhocoris]|uniref:ELMO domain-containing protein n=1 Tax=Leptomonas pyrrhocoris TaxID=157538 RepID=A0A0M9G157_LEPPY|nr:hypothetical protein ABB37_05080 [Leptomonas pyrrhocoris]XP_015658507.1 hypothetical protein ABB37_05080 [Leptomonas pyrrhocoris]XP_015658508.1 hypothetical protein ABB37_05080 [Leptomonas pyrrhocoris]KPA80067.1 hypothetical protein ABB37_05080 [Leptomonas pyrrhocoris]KPA80068.1 hypothetical protein ABB37_05080 [Leptomonas pyrrhocoris]KPA80069.1 hypothetical protein ABB37_05080 [Leptomonas pyrrhocoris]|eukprot:XP_015658506.1 hypothetical protein ABB37_05080 [Leptomonas pyrrhocoris]